MVPLMVVDDGFDPDGHEWIWLQRLPALPLAHTLVLPDEPPPMPPPLPLLVEKPPPLDGLVPPPVKGLPD
jgi:hypothetical protein